MVEGISGVLFNNRTLIEENDDLIISATEIIMGDVAITSSALAKALSKIAKNSSTDLL
jgi:hypothetical protein